MHYGISCFLVVPGQVQQLRADVMFTSIRLSWEPPYQPNGVLEEYTVSYRVGASPVENSHVDLDLSFTISDLLPGSMVEVSVSAVNGAGKGAVSTLRNLITANPPRENKYPYCDACLISLPRD